MTRASSIETGGSQACVCKQGEQLAEVMYTGRRDTRMRQGGLNQLLQRLLRVKTDEIVGHVGIVGELPEGDLIALGLA